MYDSSNEYDYRADSGPISITNFKKIICFILNWTMHDWNIPALYRMIMDFTGLAGSAITISQDSTELDTINVGMVSNGQTILFKSIVENYTFVWGIPLGITLNITLS